MTSSTRMRRHIGTSRPSAFAGGARLPAQTLSVADRQIRRFGSLETDVDARLRKCLLNACSIAPAAACSAVPRAAADRGDPEPYIELRLRQIVETAQVHDTANNSSGPPIASV